MKPYFETKLGKLYHGDCLEIMPKIHSIDALVTDPPFAFQGGYRQGIALIYQINFLDIGGEM